MFSPQIFKIKLEGSSSRVKDMEIAILSHGLRMGGAQESTLDTIKYLNELHIKVNILICADADKRYIEKLEKLNVNLSYIRCSLIRRYPIIIEVPFKSLRVLSRSDLVWINDVFYLGALKIKKLYSNKPVVAHLRSYALLCPKWNLLQGVNSLCNDKCKVHRLIKCRIKKRLDLWHISKTYRVAIERANPTFIYFDIIKGIYDYIKWPIRYTNIMEHIDGFIAVSRFVKEIHEQINPLFAEKEITVVYNPVDIYPKTNKFLDMNNSLHNKVIIVYASGKSLAKGAHIAIQAIKKVIKEVDKNVVLYMFNSMDSELLKKIIEKFSIHENVKLLPRVGRSTLHSFIKYNANLVLMPSIWPEPFGRIPVEANKLGVPVIVSNRGGLPETIINGVTGLIAEPTIDDLSQKILVSLDKKWNTEKISQIAKKTFDSRISVKKLIKYFEKFI